MDADTDVDSEGGPIPVPERFEAFYEREYPMMVALTCALTGDRLAAEDLVQDVFIDAHRRWDAIGSYDKPGAWLRRAVINRSRSIVRRRANRDSGVASYWSHRRGRAGSAG